MNTSHSTWLKAVRGGIFAAFFLGAVGVSYGQVLPAANAGPDATVTADVNGSASYTLDGSASYHPNPPFNSIISYEWTNSFGYATGVQPTVSLGVGVHIVELFVTDDLGNFAAAPSP